MKHKVIFPALALLLLCGASLFSACQKDDLPPMGGEDPTPNKTLFDLTEAHSKDTLRVRGLRSRISDLKIVEKATKTNLGEIVFEGNPTKTPYAEITYESPGIFSKVTVLDWVEIEKIKSVGDENIYVFKRIGDRNKDKKLQIQLWLWADIPYHEPVRVE
jgi:hypothetical protein